MISRGPMSLGGGGLGYPRRRVSEGRGKGIQGVEYWGGRVGYTHPLPGTTEAGGTHPTGMLSCQMNFFLSGNLQSPN